MSLVTSKVRSFLLNLNLNYEGVIMSIKEEKPTDKRVAKLARAMLRQDDWAAESIRLAESSRNENWLKVERCAVLMLKMADGGAIVLLPKPLRR